MAERTVMAARPALALLLTLLVLPVQTRCGPRPSTPTPALTPGGLPPPGMELRTGGQHPMAGPLVLTSMLVLPHVLG